jgi:hypothetical protein
MTTEEIQEKIKLLQVQLTYSHRETESISIELDRLKRQLSENNQGNSQVLLKG